MKIEIHCTSMCQLFEFETLDIQSFLVGKQMCALACWLFLEQKLLAIILQWRIQDLTLGGGVDFVNGGGVENH